MNFKSQSMDRNLNTMGQNDSVLQDVRLLRKTYANLDNISNLSDHLFEV